MSEYIYRMNEDCFFYHGYKVFRNGVILTPKGHRLRGYTYTYKGSHVKIRIGDKYTSINRAKLIYTLFSGDDQSITNKYYIMFRDNDPTNADFDNIYLGSRSEYAKAKGCDGKPRFSLNEIETIQNQYKNGEYSLRGLAREHGCSLLTIQKILGKAGFKTEAVKHA